jgi:hypothetical protein
MSATITTTPLAAKLTIANQQLQFPKVALVETSPSGYIQIAAEVDQRPPLLPGSKTKRDLIRNCKHWCKELEQEAGVVAAVVMKALIIPPGRGNFLKQRKDKVHIARFDLAVLIETESLAMAETIRRHPVYQTMERAIKEAATYTHIVTATNVKRINPVDHSRDGIFLFNYFFADDTDQNLAVWEYTAGWFQHETGLDNSTVLLPVKGEESQYNIINHCRWDRLSDILPSLLFKRTFHTYVLNNFEANHVAAMPILYRLA